MCVSICMLSTLLVYTGDSAQWEQRNPVDWFLIVQMRQKLIKTMHFEDFGFSKFNSNQMHGVRGLLLMYF